MSGPKIYKTGDVAKFCRVHPRTVRNWCLVGKIIGKTTPGGQYRFKAGDVAEFLAKQGYPVPEELKALASRRGSEGGNVTESDKHPFLVAIDNAPEEDISDEEIALLDELERKATRGRTYEEFIAALPLDPISDEDNARIDGILRSTDRWLSHEELVKSLA